MSALSIEPTYPTFTDSDGSPLDDGYVWIGAAGSGDPIGNPQTAYWDAALTQVVTQPVRTRGGYPLNAGAIGRLYVAGDYSILVRNRNGYDLYSAPNATERISSELVTFLQTGANAVTRTAQSKMRDVVSVKDFGAVGDGATDDTAAIQAAINTGKKVFLPRGVYLVDPDVGIVVKNGTVMFGEGKTNTIIVAKPNGGTVAELAAYTKGSVIKRTFNPSGANAYVSYVQLSDFALVLNHPTGSVTSTEIQIGIDLRNITRSTVRGVWVGNIAPTDQTLYPKVGPSGGYESQGYGIVCGNVSSGDPAYCGGEVNTIFDCNVVGAYKCITIDDGDLSPLSSAHSTNVSRCDIQAGHMLLVQELQYNAGTTFSANTIQNIVKQPGNVNSSFVVRIGGYNCEFYGGYIEAGQNVDYILYLGSSSKNNYVSLGYYGSVTGTAYITDAGAQNSIDYFASTATPPAVDCFGAPIRLYDNSYKLPYKSLWVKFHWDGAAVLIDGSSGNVSVVRNNAGDYTVNYSKAFPSDDYAIAVTLDTNASGHGGMVAVGSHSSSAMRIFTYAQNGGTSTQIDPRYVWVQVSVN